MPQHLHAHRDLVRRLSNDGIEKMQEHIRIKLKSWERPADSHPFNLQIDCVTNTLEVNLTPIALLQLRDQIEQSIAGVHC